MSLRVSHCRCSLSARLASPEISPFYFVCHRLAFHRPKTAFQQRPVMQVLLTGRLPTLPADCKALQWRQRHRGSGMSGMHPRQYLVYRGGNSFYPPKVWLRQAPCSAWCQVLRLLHDAMLTSAKLTTSNGCGKYTKLRYFACRIFKSFWGLYPQTPIAGGG
jgi:hypothetical protein